MMPKSSTTLAAWGLLLSALTGLSGSAGAVTRTAPDCQLGNVQAAVNASADGDMVSVPAGTCSWSGPLIIQNKTLTLQGAGNFAGGTKIVYSGTGHTLFAINAGNKTGRMDISGF